MLASCYKRRIAASYCVFIKRWISTTQNNITYHMGLDASGSHAAETALILNDADRLTYRDLSKKVGSMVTLLHTTFGLNRGDRVLSRVEKSADSLVLYLATIRLGAVYVPLNPAFTLAETVHFVDDSDPDLFVSSNTKQDGIFANKVKRIVDSTALFEESRQMVPDYGTECVRPDDIACICYTAGTTGSPKGAMISHGGLTWNAQMLIDMWKFSQKDVLLHMLPFDHIHGIFISLNCSLFTKSSVIFSAKQAHIDCNEENFTSLVLSSSVNKFHRPKFDVDDALSWLPHCTVMMGVPTYYSRLMRRSNFGKDITKNTRLFISGSAPLSTVLWENFKERTGHEILERYGMTEAGVITTNLYNDRRSGSVGKVLPGGDIRIAEGGVVQIRLPSLFLGYWKNQDKTQKVFTEDGFFNTGDIGKIDDDGFLWLHGREKDLIITGGLNVYPKEVEDAVDSLPYVLESAVIGVPHDDLGEAVLAVCVSESGNYTFLHEAEAVHILHTKLASYKIPKRFLCIDQLPKNAMGKVQKNILRKRYHGLFCAQ